MFPNIHQFPYLALDTETTGLLYKIDKVFGVSLSTPDGKDYYWDVRAQPQAIQWLKDEMVKYKGHIIYANSSFDIRMLENSGVNLLSRNFDDVITIASCINEHLPVYTLDAICNKYLGVGKDTEIYEKLAEIFGGRKTKNVQMRNISRAPIELVAPYAKMDTRRTLELWEWQQEEITRQDIRKIVDFEKAVQPDLIGMEMHGIRIDAEYAEEAADKITPIIDELQKKINHFFGTEVNVNSAPQIKALYDPKLKDGEWYANDGTLLGKTPKGNPSLGADALREMTNAGAVDILDLRSIIKTRDTFLRGHVLGHAVGGRVYPTINQSKAETGGTGTGRLSIQNPAMQQIPNRNKKVAAIAKPCFLPDEGEKWVDADMASFEVRVFAHLANDEKVIGQYRKDSTTDFHQFVANLTGLVRDATYSGQPNAKQLNLSMIFNSGNGAIADKMGMEWEWQSFYDKNGKKITYKKAGPEAMKVIEAYHKELPGVRKLAEGAKNAALKRGYVFTKYGRRLRFPRGFKAYKASGLLIQATSADINKENIMIINSTIKDRGHLLLNTHDSYSMSMPEETWQETYDEIKSKIERPALNIPLQLDLSGVGDDWYDAIRKDK